MDGPRWRVERSPCGSAVTVQGRGQTNGLGCGSTCTASSGVGICSCARSKPSGKPLARRTDCSRYTPRHGKVHSCSSATDRPLRTSATVWRMTRRCEAQTHSASISTRKAGQRARRSSTRCSG